MSGRVGVEQTPDIEAAWERIKRASWEGGNPAAIEELAAAVREARAAELREARDDLYAGCGPDFVADSDIVYGEWLGNRADRIAVDAPEGGAYLCRICGQMVTSGSDRAHDGASHDARTADLPTPKGGA